MPGTCKPRNNVTSTLRREPVVNRRRGTRGIATLNENPVITIAEHDDRHFLDRVVIRIVEDGHPLGGEA